MPKKVSAEQQRALNQTRCPVCGKWHPFIAICPYIKATRVETIRDARNPNLRGRITTTEYFPREKLMESAVESLDEAEKVIQDDPNDAQS